LKRRVFAPLSPDDGVLAIGSGEPVAPPPPRHFIRAPISAEEKRKV